MHCEQRLSRPNRTITGLALLQLCLKVYLRKGCSFSTHPCHPHRKYISCLASNKTRQCIFLNVDYLHATPFTMIINYTNHGPSRKLLSSECKSISISSLIILRKINKITRKLRVLFQFLRYRT